MTMLPIPTDPEAWHALRAQHVGASEVAALFNAQPDYAPGLYALWHQKAGIVPREPVDNPRVAWGLRLEDAIAAGAAERGGWDVRPGLYASRDGLGATLDRIIAAPGAEERDAGLAGPGVLELKNADWLYHKRAWGDEPPLFILLQLQAQLLATGYGWGAVAVLVGGNDLRIYRYRPRPKVQAEIARRVAAFWDSIRRGKKPDPDGSGSAFRTIQALHPEVQDEPAELDDDNEAPILAAEVLALAKQRKEIERQEAECKARLLAKLGDHRWGKVRGFRISQAITPAKEPVQITADMIGNTLPGRAESRRLIVTEQRA
ncbi:MAG: YqaJ viral recombinase family protein [Acetobacteraceae bacterium]|nr:YqaJ viral recombinase family protein [Acetobacteraceae bacterium]